MSAATCVTMSNPARKKTMSMPLESFCVPNGGLVITQSKRPRRVGSLDMSQQMRSTGTSNSATFSAATLSASGSMSTAKTCDAPRIAAPMPRMPPPQPRSATAA